MTAAADVLIVGGGLGAVHVARALRSNGFDGTVVVASREAVAPYDRPPLTKGVLTGAQPVRTLLDEEAARASGIGLALGAEAVAVDRAAGAVHFANGTGIGYRQLVVATGAQPRELPALQGLPGVVTVRDAVDSRALADRLRPGHRLVVLGAGFLGLEVAASARTLGCEVTVVESAPVPLARALGPDLALWLLERHRDRGVTMRCGATVVSAAAGDAGVELMLSDDAVLAADSVVVSVGIRRDVGWLASAGLEVHAGLVVDTDGRTADPAVWGIGDVTCLHRDGGCEAAQHWTAVTTQAPRVAQSVLGLPVPPPEPVEGYVWSDQYELKLQLVGTSSGAQAHVVESSTEGYLAEYRRDGRLVGAAAVNRPRDLLQRRIALRRGVA